MLDAGALIQLEKGPHKARILWKALTDGDREITVPVAAFVEWWHENAPFGGTILKAIEVAECLTLDCAKKAGRARSRCGKHPPSAVDAIVMALAAELGAVVYTTDHSDLERLRQFFPSVKLLRPR